MDTATHALLGVACSEALFRRRLGPAANVVAAVSAALPDIDSLIFRLTGDPWLSLLEHRGPTHSLLFCLLASLPVALVAHRLSPRNKLLPLYLCAALAILSHPLLDIFTSYGTRLFQPFSNLRLSLDSICVVDLQYSAILVIAVLTCAMARRVDRASLAPKVAAAALALTSAYIGLGYLVQFRAVEAFRRAAVRSGHQLVRARAIPLIGDLVSWRLVGETSDGFLLGFWDLGDPAPTRLKKIAGYHGPLVRRLWKNDILAEYRRFADGYVWLRPVSKGRAAPRLFHADDLRYGFPGVEGSLWRAVVRIDREGRVLSVQRRRSARPDPGRLLTGLKRMLRRRIHGPRR